MSVVELYCTGRGTHRRRNLQRLYEQDGVLYLAERLYGAAPAAGQTPRVGPPKAAGVRGTGSGDIGHKSTNVPCRVCRRSPALSTRSLGRLLDAGLAEVDISRLPF